MPPVAAAEYQKATELRAGCSPLQHSHTDEYVFGSPVAYMIIPSYSLAMNMPEQIDIFHEYKGI